ncbi:MAG: aminotransferase class I/II-fold pyridoxal phosphate-dependent enzyme [Peptococcaceae bacterium]|nr:aminotransferase class I/II-fold pyridoxal phosphate-dependent enzyme [Peptococcaceae bacterium]
MSILAKHAQGKGGPDVIFAYSAQANKRAEAVGKENIVNATIGAFLNADGSLKTMDTVEAAIESIPFAIGANYAPINGLPEYIEAMTDSVLRDHRPAGTYTAGIATPGGTGALHNGFFNYLNEGEVCLTTDYYWGNYKSLLSEMGRGLETFNTFTDDGHFDIASCKAACEAVAAKQTNVVLLLNTPAHNPTGFSVTDEEWQEIIPMLTAIANNGKNNVVLMIDTAYIDYAGPHARDFFEFFTNLPENFLVIVCASTSKGYTLYGYRLGLMLCIAQSQAVCDEFELADGASARATWSNCSRPAMEAVTLLNSDDAHRSAFRKEQDEFAASLAKRSDIFMKEAKEVGLAVCPYHSGFFIFVPTPTHEDAVAMFDVLADENIFAVPLGAGMRIAICAVDDAKIPGMATKFKAAYDKVVK